MGGFTLTPTGEQTSDWSRVQAIMSSLRPPRAGNPRVLVNDQLPLLRAKTGGYPKWMYHAEMDAVYVMREDQEEELVKLGYTTAYVPHLYPRTLYRRNLDPKFAARPDLGTGVAPNNEYVEERIARDAKHEEAIRKEKAPRTVLGGWQLKLDDIADMPEQAAEDPAVTIARLEGQLLASSREHAGSPGKHKE
jgi:hypothetical protein